MYTFTCFALFLLTLLFPYGQAGNSQSAPAPERGNAPPPSPPPSPEPVYWGGFDVDQLRKVPVVPFDALREAPKEEFEALIPDLEEMQEAILQMPQFKDRDKPLDFAAARRQTGKPAFTKPLRKNDPIAIDPSRFQKKQKTLTLDVRDWPQASWEPLTLDGASSNNRNWTMRPHQEYPIVYFNGLLRRPGTSDDRVRDLRDLYVNRLSTASKVALYHDVQALDTHLASLIAKDGRKLKIADDAQALLADMMWVLDTSAKVHLRSDIAIPLSSWRKEDFKAFALAMSDHHIALNKPDDLLLDYLMAHGRLPHFEQRKVSPRLDDGSFDLPPHLSRLNFDFFPSPSTWANRDNYLYMLKRQWPTRQCVFEYTTVEERKADLISKGVLHDETESSQEEEEKKRQQEDQERVKAQRARTDEEMAKEFKAGRYAGPDKMGYTWTIEDMKKRRRTRSA